MDPLVSTLAVILIALLGARLSFSTERVPAGARLLFRTGTHFLFLGMLLGPLVLDLLTPTALERLTPLLGLGLGWIGLLFGLQLERETLASFPWTFHVVAVGQAAITFALFLAGAFGLMQLGGWNLADHAALAVAAAATAAVSAPAGIALISTNFLVRGQVRRLLFFAASIDGLVGIVLLHGLYSALLSAAPGGGVDGDRFVLWLAAGAALGAVCGILFVWLLRLRPDAEELVLYILGISALCAGAALQLGISPLFAGLVLGAIVANLARDRARVFTALQRWEQPIYLVLLILAGSLLRLPSWWIAPAVVGYTALRTLGKLVGLGAVARVTPLDFELPRGSGLGLLPQGGISLAMAISLVLTLDGRLPSLGGVDAATGLFAVVVLGVVLSELAGPALTTRVLRSAGEIRREVEQAIAEGDEERARTEAIRHHATGSADEADVTGSADGTP